jgi:hypothetical protein
VAPLSTRQERRAQELLALRAVVVTMRQRVQRVQRVQWKDGKAPAPPSR